MTSSWSDHSRIMIMVGSFSDRSRIVNDTSSVFGQVFFDFGMQFAWQAQNLVRLEGDACCSAHSK